MVKASLVEGKGPFSCTNEAHAEEFKTTNLKEFNEHLLQHSYYGTVPCPICDKPVVIPQDKPIPNGKRPRCDECKKEDY